MWDAMKGYDKWTDGGRQGETNKDADNLAERTLGALQGRQWTDGGGDFQLDAKACSQEIVYIYI